jgi:hypothetical protein
MMSKLVGKVESLAGQNPLFATVLLRRNPEVGKSRQAPGDAPALLDPVPVYR